MTYHPITLGINLGAWRLFTLRKEDKGFAPFRDKVFQRDQYTCQFCGFHAKKYQEVINLDGNYRSNVMRNLVTACCFCAQCFFLEAVGRGEYGGGQLIYLPDMSQSDLNALCHVLFCSMENVGTYRAEAQAIYNDLRALSQPLEEKFGKGLSNPVVLAQVMIDTPMDQERKRMKANETLTPLRLLPSKKRFMEQIQVWGTSVLNENNMTT